MKKHTSRLRKAAVVGAAGALAISLAACTTSGSGDDTNSSGGDAGGTITIGIVNAVTALSSGTPAANLDSNGMVDFLTGSGRGYGSGMLLSDKFEVVHDETNVSYERTSDDPLTVTYTVTEGAKWSDGEDITADDLFVSWAIFSGYYDDATIDEESGEPTAGNQYFQLAGSTAGLDTTALPEISDDNRSLTLVYGEPYVDWELVTLLDKPAHVFAEAAGMSTEELTAHLRELPQGDPAAPAAEDPALRAMADLWNTGYEITSMPTDENLLVTSGPFVVSDFTPNDGGSITLKKNPEWTGDEPAYDELILRFIADANAQVSALRNGEVDAIQPQASRDTVTALESAGANVITGDQLAFDHLDLSFGSDSGVFADPAVREAFLLTIPRQQILEAIVTPVNPEAEVLNSEIFVPANEGYDASVEGSTYASFTEPDIARATELLAGQTPTVRILYNTNNPNRVTEFSAIQASAAQAGFQIVDAGSPDWSSLLGNTDYDASLFGWVSPGAGYASLPQIMRTGGGGNYNQYSNAEVDALVDESQTIVGDDARLTEIQQEIDRLTSADFYGLPLFQSPGIIATSDRVEGMSWFGGQDGIVWNALEWTIKG